MPHHFSILVDKSALQGLTRREALWLFHHFRVNVPPVFFAEILGDLQKEKGLSTSTGEGDVMMLTSKVEPAFIDLNAEASSLVAGELHGHSFPMDGRPVIDHAELVEMPDGKYGMSIDQTPMQRVMDRWKSGDFEGMEKAFAQVWRRQLAGIDLQKIIQLTKYIRIKAIDTPAAVARLVERIIFKPNQNHVNLELWMRILGVPQSWKNMVMERWKREGRPPAIQFLPYTAYVARLKVFFYLAVGHHVITARSSNQIDIEYFKYLPFAKVFCSSDKLHLDLFSQFALNNQMFIHGADMKNSLREMADFYEAMSPEAKSHGSFTYADYPPVEMNNAVTKAFDQFLPNWREGANQPRPPRDPEADAKIIAHLKPIVDAFEKASKNRK